MFLNIDLNVKTNLIDPAYPVVLTPSEVKERTWGSKTVLLVEQCMCAVQWGTKACLLLLYWRLTQNLTQGLIVKCAAVYVGATYIVMLILYFAVWCRPFHDYWQVPAHNMQCPTALNHLITNLVFNLSSDLLIMSIPLPLFIRAHLEVKKKLLLIFPFSLGFFTIVCAILSKHLSFTNPYSAEWVFWYCREASTAVIVTNMPYSWALLRRIFKLKSFFGDSGNQQMDGGMMEEVQGHSLGTLSAQDDLARQQSHATSHASKRKRSWPWHKSHPNQQLSSNPNPPTLEHGLDRVRTASLEKDVQVRTSAPSNSDSSTGSIRKPPPARTKDSTAVDKLYQRDFDDDDDDGWERPGTSTTAHNG